MITNKIDRETAGAEFDRWAEECEIDVDVESEEDIKAVATFKDKFVKRAMAGRLVFNDEEGRLEFTPKGAEETLNFSEPMGDLLNARQKKDTDIQAARRTLAAWCGVSPVVFAKMPLREFNFCSELLGFFGNS